MFEDILEVLLSPLGLIYLSIFPAGRRLIRRTAKAILHATYKVSDDLKDIVCEVKQEIVAAEPSQEIEAVGKKTIASAIDESFEPELLLKIETEAKQPVFEA